MKKRDKLLGDYCNVIANETMMSNSHVQAPETICYAIRSLTNSKEIKDSSSSNIYSYGAYHSLLSTFSNLVSIEPPLVFII